MREASIGSQVAFTDAVATCVGCNSRPHFHATNSRQLQPELIEAGFTAGQLDAFRALLRDPGFAVMSYQFVSTRGRRPGGWAA
ncbi:hypothetical protein [Micromonospora costi]|uniref:Uncharacterized protein n=1 Tax=Micromonospora costi TaxID=1530042 RepID=A0A3A9ZWW7_9ACTN|nr:hypothetical protein [Micromonospora costi]RKN52789.1 hypothetical protein D7193_23440 [Micromonospora costi]